MLIRRPDLERSLNLCKRSGEFILEGDCHAFIPLEIAWRRTSVARIVVSWQLR
jgi:hypothetical protein